MRVAIDTIPLLSPLTGVGIYTYQIAKALQEIDQGHEYSYFYGYYSSRLISPGDAPESFYRLKENIRRIPLLGAMARGLKDLVNFIPGRPFDLYFEPNFIPLRIPAKRIVVTVPDFSFTLYPQWHEPDKVRFFKRHFWKKINRADRVIAISDFIRTQAIQEFGFPADRWKTIHLGFDLGSFRVYPPEDLQGVKDRYHLPENFILFVGSIEPRKNLKNLLLAYRDLGEKVRKDCKLVLVGFKGWKNEEIMGLIHELRDGVHYLGYVPEAELGKIYNLARLFVYPSLYEGFGLPPIEAMACGCPVIASRAASLPEVCGDAAWYVDPNDVASIADGITNLLDKQEMREALAIKGITRARGFNWEKSALEHLKIFKQLVQS